MFSKALKYIAVVAATILLSACFNSDLDVTARFSDAQNLRTGAAVTFNGVTIGEVKELQLEDGSVVAQLTLEAEAAQQVQANAVAIIDAEPPQIKLSNPAVTAQAIKDGAQLEGLSTAIELATWQAGDTVGALQNALQEAMGSVNDYFSSEQWQQSKQQTQQLMESLEEQTLSAGEQIKDDYEAFLQALESESENAIKNAEKSLDDLRQRLLELQKQGEQDAIQFLQQLLDRLEQALQQKNAEAVSA